MNEEYVVLVHIHVVLTCSAEFSYIALWILVLVMEEDRNSICSTSVKKKDRHKKISFNVN